MSSTAYQKGQQTRLENWPCFFFLLTSTNMLSRAARWLRPRALAGEATSATREKPPDVRTPKLARSASWPLLGWRRRHAATPLFLVAEVEWLHVVERLHFRKSFAR